jgi:hypothetical protein
MAVALNNVFNSLVQRYRGGRAVYIKARGGIGRLAHVAANLFFRVGKIPISFCTDPHFWQRWEVRCYRTLNGRFTAYPIGKHRVVQEKLPGKNLWEHMQKGTLTPKMIRAAAREFRRAHATPSEHFDDGLWSHGDGTMANVIYDPATARARLIDFEILHRRDLPAVKRHADDLLVFLFDLVSMSPRKRWLGMALEFLRTYGDSSVIAQVEKRLRAPAGLYRIWWHVRTNFVETHIVMRRLLRLRDAIRSGSLSAERKNRHRSQGRKSVIQDPWARVRGYDTRSGSRSIKSTVG